MILQGSVQNTEEESLIQLRNQLNKEISEKTGQKALFIKSINKINSKNLAILTGDDYSAEFLIQQQNVLKKHFRYTSISK